MIRNERNSLQLTQPQLYGIIDLAYVVEANVSVVTNELIKGGIDLLQLRAKEYPVKEILKIGTIIQPICQEKGIPFIVNDHLQVALELDADGLHLGQDDGCLDAAAKQLGKDKYLGRSTHSIEQAVQAIEQGVDYIGFGPLFATDTKPGRPAIGLAGIKILRQKYSNFPVFCIGGIQENNLEEVLLAGADRIVMVSGLLKASSIYEATCRVKDRLSAIDL